MKKPKFTIALEGNPNTGKSTIFNALTGLKQHCGNWPGKTVEKKEGLVCIHGKDLNIVDLPGTYALTYYTIEEKIARDFVIKNEPEVVIDIINASSLERNLYLALQTMELTDNIIIALNMMDIAKRKGIEIDVKKLSEILGVPVVPTVATTEKGLKKLKDTLAFVMGGKITPKPNVKIFSEHIEQQIEEIEELLKEVEIEGYPLRWLAIKLLENDPEIVIKVNESKNCRGVMDKIQELRKQEIHHNFEIEIADQRYEYISKIVEQCIKKPKKRMSRTDKIDSIVLNKYLGLPILVGIFALTFFITFSISAPIMELVDGLFGTLAKITAEHLVVMGAPELLVGLLTEGIIAGVGGVAVFLPLIMLFFLLFGVIEDSGYMARAAFVMDKTMHTMGLHGKTFLSLLMGYGCNIPGIMATRTLEKREDRLIAILINPFIPCAARLGVMTVIVAIFFSGLQATVIMLSMLVFSLMIVVVSGVIFRKFLFQGEHSPFIMELPSYHIPTLKNVGLLVWERSGVFISKAGTIIVLVSIVVWILSSFPQGVDIEMTYLGMLGKSLEPFGKTMGFDWKIMVSLVTGFAAKETSITTLGILYGLEEEVEESVLAIALLREWTPLVALTFLLVQMLYVPCLATVAIMKKETNSWKYTLIGVGWSLFVAFGICITFYQIGLMFGFG